MLGVNRAARPGDAGSSCRRRRARTRHDAAVKKAGAASPEREGNRATSSFEDLVQYNDGFRSNLIGTLGQIAERILALKDAGADLALLGFRHFQEEVAWFGEQVILRVRALEAARAERRAAAS